MPEHHIEILGQKFSYPSTWQGAFSILIVCTCIGFLGYTLDSDEITSYSKLFSKEKSEGAYNESLATIAELNSQIGGMQKTIHNLTSKANLAEKEKTKVYAKLEKERQIRKKALLSLSQHQEDKVVSDFVKSFGGKDIAGQQYLDAQQQKIQQQLINIQQQQFHSLP